MLGYIRANPADACILPRVEKTEIFPLDEVELKAFLSVIAGHPLENLYRVAVFTGMREGELLGLTWDRVDLQRGKVDVNRQLFRPRKKGGTFKFGPLKNDKPRQLTPAPSVMETLKAQKKVQAIQRLYVGPLWEDGPGYVFTNEMGGHASYWTLITWLKKLLHQAGIAPRRFHDLRHTYAVSSIRAGDDIKTVQHNLGHHTAAFTLDVYGHVTEQMKKDSASRMEAYINSLGK